MRTAIPGIALVIGLALGFLVGGSFKDRSTPALDERDKAATEGLVKRDEFDREIAELREKQRAAELETKAAQTLLEKQATELVALRAERDGLREKADLLQAEVAKLAEAQPEDRETRMKRITARFQKLKEQGLSNFVSTDAMGKFIADLRQEGELGREAVLTLLNSDSAEERLFATHILMQGMGFKEAIDPLREMALNDSDVTNKHMASQALMRMDGDDVLPTLRDLSANANDDGVRVNSMFGLMMRGEGVEQAVAFYQNKDNDEYMRSALGGSVFLLDKKPEIQPMIDAVVADAMGSPGQGNVVDAAVKYYASVKTPEALAALRSLADNPQLSTKSKEKVSAAIAGFNN